MIVLRRFAFIGLGACEPTDSPRQLHPARKRRVPGGQRLAALALAPQGSQQQTELAADGIKIPSQCSIDEMRQQIPAVRRIGDDGLHSRDSGACSASMPDTTGKTGQLPLEGRSQTDAPS